MACAHPNQDRYIVISLPTASRKVVHLACCSFAGYGTAYPTPCLNPYSGCFFAFLQNALAWPRTPITPISPSHILLSPLWATVDATKSP
jgi:hypothetical protein